MRGLPFSATKDDIITFFDDRTFDIAPLVHDSIHIVTSIEGCAKASCFAFGPFVTRPLALSDPGAALRVLSKRALRPLLPVAPTLQAPDRRRFRRVCLCGRRQDGDAQGPPHHGQPLRGALPVVEGGGDQGGDGCPLSGGGCSSRRLGAADPSLTGLATAAARRGARSVLAGASVLLVRILFFICRRSSCRKCDGALIFRGGCTKAAGKEARFFDQYFLLCQSAHVGDPGRGQVVQEPRW